MSKVSSAQLDDYSQFKNVLKGAKMGEVVTRFPPEPSGFLHIGHVKAAMLNFHYARMWQGKMILRFDDTNPMNEKVEFVDNILRDLKLLDIVPDQVTYSSDHFDKLKECAETLIKKGLAYADDTPAEEMKEQRDEGIESKHRANTTAKNLEYFKGMLAGKSHEVKVKDANGKEVTQKRQYCIRAKMNMQDKVKCLRDPVLYRCKDEKHHRTGDKYKAYPTYDLTCPVVDSIEGVTHALRTIEYRDRNALYDWVQDSLELRKSVIYDFSKLNLTKTVLSKRKLRWFVDEGHVEGWNDPRFPTVQGIMRKGMTTKALRDFMLEQGASQRNNFMEWDKIYAKNKQIIDPIVPRYTAINKDKCAKFKITNGPEKPEAVMEALHNKNTSLGKKPVMKGRNLLIEKSDVFGPNKDGVEEQLLKEGQKVTLMKWGNVNITKVKKSKSGDYEIEGTYDPDDQDFKGTTKLTWLCDDPNTTMEIKHIEFDHLITKDKIEETDEIQNLVNKGSRIESTLVCEALVRNLPRGTIFQFERKGFMFVDQIELVNQPCVVHFIPDGKEKKIDGTKDIMQEKKKVEKKEIVPAGEDGKLSKKQLAKLAKQDKKAAAKAAAKGEGEEQPATGAPAQQRAGPPKKAQGISSYFDGPLADFWEALLEDQQWLSGAGSPSQADAEALKQLGGRWPNPALYPNLYGWFSLCDRFTPEKQKSWAAGECPMPSGY